MRLLTYLFITFAISILFSTTSEASTRSSVLYQTDESGRLAITGERCKSHYSSCNGVAVKDLTTGKFLFKENKTPGRTKTTSSREGRYYNFAMAPSGEFFGFFHEYYDSNKKYFYVYQTSPLKILHKIKGGNWDGKAEFSQSGKLLAIGDKHSIGVFNVQTGKRIALENMALQKLKTGYEGWVDVFGLGITPDDSKLLVSFENGIAAWDLKTGINIYTHRNKETPEYQFGAKVPGSPIQFHPKTGLALTADVYTTVFNPDNGMVIKSVVSAHTFSPSQYGLKANFLNTTEEPLLIVKAPENKYAKEFSPGIFIYNWKTTALLSKIGNIKDDYIKLRKHAELIVHPDYTKSLFGEFREAKNNDGITLLRELSKLYNDNNNGLTDYFPKRKKWLKSVKSYWQQQAEAQIKQAEQENKNKQLMALIVSGYLEPKDNQNKLTHRAVASYYEVIKRQKDIDALINMSIMANVPPKIKEASLLEALTLTQGEKALDFYLDIADKTSFTKVKDLAFSMVYDRVKQADNIASYQWYITHVPKSKHTKEALDKLYENAYELADDRGTIESYNDFIIAYPYAPQVNDAMEQAKDLEESEYSSFFTSDEELSRRLLVRSKQISRLAQQQSYDDTGYLLIVDRMNTMLQDMYPGAEATLRHLESEEFKDFHRDFNRAMRSLNSKLDDINSNVRDLKRHVSKQSNMMDQHFEKAAQDRETASELTRQHRMWERYLKGKV